MSIRSYLKSFYYLHLSKPARERCLYRAIVRRRMASIVELGVGLTDRGLRMIRVASLRSDCVQYTGIDAFESRSPDTGPGLTLKHAYQRLRTTGARLQLVPGDPLTALARVANSLRGTDLLVISADVDPESLRQAWFYVPRMLHPRSLVYVEEVAADGANSHFVQLAAGEINRLAEACQPLRRKAA